jgi:hypothetical protein
MLIDELELDREVAPKMSAAFFGISGSICSRLFSRRKRVFLLSDQTATGPALP